MKFTTAIAMLLLVLGAANVLALSSDRNEQIHIKSDAATIDDKKGISTYTGNVTVDQGSLHIRADRVEVHAEANVVTKIIASVDTESDNLAHYEQLPDNKPLVVAEAKRIVYFLRDEKLKLSGNASLTQTEDRRFSGELIDYDVESGRVSARSDGDERVITTFKPPQE